MYELSKAEIAASSAQNPTGPVTPEGSSRPADAIFTKRTKLSRILSTRSTIRPFYMKLPFLSRMTGDTFVVGMAM